MKQRPRAVLAMASRYVAGLFPAPVLDRLRASADLDPEVVIEDFGEAELADVDVLITGWGCPPITAEVLERAPRLRAAFHAAGGVKAHVTDACWERGLRITSAAEMNALPVAEFALAAILLAGKDAFGARESYREHREPGDPAEGGEPGNFGARVGVIGASRTGRRLIELLWPFDLQVAVSDPFLSPEEAQALGVELLELPELLATSDIVTVQAPDLPETRNMLDAAELALLRDGATLVNTARGALVNTAALTRELVAGRINAVLDVTEPEVLPVESPLWTLPNVFLTPHLAGSRGNELARLGACAVRELELFAAGKPAAYPVYRDELARLA
ncbi:hydroxyacid dehydrogenase [Amycolatopsis dendrobii]|uniref:Hydroxyacid dehydrogenase n=1 Tax=Amycolatopsis dendrobii TaxID=2760662 RepID=A0A7W3VZ98_9PSEU|nr:hydroxyacid dehydrogenase [Amycolatopsis dendrobii]MBB1155432.1 hydroxyacid dehydrogenase [Amycolatopsis dendrobii]